MALKNADVGNAKNIEIENVKGAESDSFISESIEEDILSAEYFEPSYYCRAIDDPSWYKQKLADFSEIPEDEIDIDAEIERAKANGIVTQVADKIIEIQKTKERQDTRQDTRQDIARRDEARYEETQSDVTQE